MSAQAAHATKQGPGRKELDQVVIRFAGDSGDGMQLTGDRFTSATAFFGNDLATAPDFPAEIRAPAGTIPGVSAFQIHFSNHEILTAGDKPGVLVAMNPAALQANLKDLIKGGLLIVNRDAFEKRNLDKAGYSSNPLEDGSLESYQVYDIPMTSMTREAVKDLGLGNKEAGRSKNMFALGVISWMYGRSLDPTIRWLEKKFAKQPSIAQANVAALKTGHAFGETAELTAFEVKPAVLAPGTYRRITGNQALAYGLIAASVQAKVPLFLGSYPITPASDILHELSRHKNFGVRTMQAEDEIAAAGMALGASFAGHLGVTTTSGPGSRPEVGDDRTRYRARAAHDHRGRPARGPVDGPSHEGRTVRSTPRPLRTPRRSPPSDRRVLLAAVVFLGGARGRPPGDQVHDSGDPALRRLPRERRRTMAHPVGREAAAACLCSYAAEPNVGDEFWPYLRDDETLSRPWAIPGTPGMEHRVGGLEKADGTGNISYEPENHELMTMLRAAKIKVIEEDIDPLEWQGDEDATTLVLGWGSTYGAIGAACRRLRANGVKIANAHLKHLNPFPRNTRDVLERFDRIVIPELNTGQLSKLIRSEFMIDSVSINKVQGVPFMATDLEEELAGLV